jgi:hypothetical protein
VYVLCSPANLMVSQNNNISLRGLRKSAPRRACALERSRRCFRHSDIDHILNREHQFTLLFCFHGFSRDAPLVCPILLSLRFSLLEKVSALLGISFGDGVATRVHAPPFYTWYVTRVFKTGAVPPPKIGSRVMYPWIFQRLIFFAISTWWQYVPYLETTY